MAGPVSKSDFFADLVAHIQEHSAKTRRQFQPLAAQDLSWSPAPKEWSILQCFDHLNQTHVYYVDKIAEVLPHAPQDDPALGLATGQAPVYKPAFWARVYMFFALNPRFSFPAPDTTTPQAQPDVTVLDTFLEKQQALLNLLESVETVDLVQTRIPIKKSVYFNLGDCLKIMVYHDALHMRQAEGVLRARAQTATSGN